MIYDALWKYLEQEVFPFPSNDELWNPYLGNQPELDLPRGDEIRRSNLRNYLASFSRPPRILLIGEAPGPWGCRFSGLAFTGERQFTDGGLPFAGQPTSTFNPPCVERSGTIVWGTLKPHFPDFFLWNCIPYHPYNIGNPLSIRTPRNSEITQFSDILEKIIQMIGAQQVIAIGRKSEYALKRIGINANYLRHPSFGGASAFRLGVSEYFKLYSNS
jgi:uracil-DNA glycosylase